MTTSTASKRSSLEHPLNRLPTLEQVRAEKARRNFAEFVRQAWIVLNPGRQLQWAWYLQAMCDHLQAVTQGRIRRLAITLPPNTLKSFIVSVCWPAWQWATDASIRFLVAANDGPLATRDALAMRTLLESEWFNEHYRSSGSFAGEWGLAEDQDEKRWYATSRGGHRISYSVNSRVTGKKGDVLIVDDANDARKVHGAGDREAVIGWHDDAFSGRIADEKTSPEVIVGQRTHTRDLIGHCLTQPGWVELRLPERFNPLKPCCTVIGYEDPRTEHGELLRPARFGPAEVADRTAVLGSIGFLCQHDQDPQNPQGYRFKREWFAHRYTVRGEYLVLKRPGEAAERVYRWQDCRRFGTCDGAASAKQSACFTVAGAWLETPRRELVLLDGIRFQAEIPDQVAPIQKLFDDWKLAFIGIEAVASNVGLFQLAQRTRMTVKRLNPLGQDKLIRATQALVLAESGRIWLPEPGVRPGMPLAAIETELLLFTGAEGADEYSDSVDMIAYAAKIMSEGPSDEARRAVPMIIGGNM